MKQFVINILAQQAKRLIKKVQPEIVAVTGSVGKSSTKDAIAAVLKMRYQVLRSPKNYNTEFGLPCAVLGLESAGKSAWGWAVALLKGFWRSHWPSQSWPKLFVLEMGSDHPGDIARLCAIAPPKIGVVTTVAAQHAEAYGSIEDIAKEKSVLISKLSAGGVAVLNRDDERVWAMRSLTSAKIISFGFSPEAEVRATHLAIKFDYAGGVDCGVSFQLEHAGSSATIILAGTIGRQAVSAALAAAAVGLAKGLNLMEIVEGLSDFMPPVGRMRCLAGIKHTLLIDDTYNAALKAVLAGLEAVASLDFPGDERKIVVLGDMLGLGQYTQGGHEEVGQLVAKYNFDLAVFVGTHMVIAERAAVAAGLAENKVMHFAKATEAGLFVQEKMKSGDVVFIKGSRDMHLEKVVQELMAEPLRANELLVNTEEH